MDSVGFQLAGGGQPLVIVPTWVNGEGPFQFIFDTGAGITLVEPALARRLGVEGGEVKEGRVAGGSTAVTLGWVASLSVGAARVEDLEIGILDLSDLKRATGAEIDGDIGYNFLRHFTVTLDYPGRILHLTKSNGAAGSAGAEIGFRLGQPSKPLVLVPVFVNGAGPFQFAVDTGASMTILAPDLARDLGLRTQPAPAISTGGGLTSQVSQGRLDALTLGGAGVHHLPVLIAGFLEPLSQVIGARLDGIIGYNFLKEFVVTIDYPKERLRLVGF